MYLLMSRVISQAVARSRKEPCLRILRNAVARPCGQRGQQCVAQRVFSARDIVGARCEQRDKASVRFARYRLDRAVRLFISSGFQSVMRRSIWEANGRTSTAPYDAAGQRAAHSNAASSDGSSSSVKPPNCSLVLA